MAKAVLGAIPSNLWPSAAEKQALVDTAGVRSLHYGPANLRRIAPEPKSDLPPDQRKSVPSRSRVLRVGRRRGQADHAADPAHRVDAETRLRPDRGALKPSRGAEDLKRAPRGDDFRTRTASAPSFPRQDWSGEAAQSPRRFAAVFLRLEALRLMKKSFTTRKRPRAALASGARSRALLHRRDLSGTRASFARRIKTAKPVWRRPGRTTWRREAEFRRGFRRFHPYRTNLRTPFPVHALPVSFP